MSLRSLSRAAVACLALVAVVACSDDESPSGGHGSVESVKLFDVATDTELTSPYQFVAGATTRVEVRFYDGDGNLLNEDLAGSHFTSLVFTPAEFATVANVEGEPFQRDVTATETVGATATVTIGYGHDEAANEQTYGPYDAEAVAAE